jgi:HNH endonuclease
MSKRLTATGRFWAGLTKTETCWFWGNGKHKRYSTISVNGKPIKTHRFSWELHNGPIPDGMEVCHSCDVEPCCNPAHLWLGTHQENMQDALSKGRLKLPEDGGAPRRNQTHCKRGHEFTPENTKMIPSGRNCRICFRTYQKKWRAKQKTIGVQP